MAVVAIGGDIDYLLRRQSEQFVCIGYDKELFHLSLYAANVTLLLQPSKRNARNCMNRASLCMNFWKERAGETFFPLAVGIIAGIYDSLCFVLDIVYFLFVDYFGCKGISIRAYWQVFCMRLYEFVSSFAFDTIGQLIYTCLPFRAAWNERVLLLLNCYTTRTASIINS